MSYNKENFEERLYTVDEMLRLTHIKMKSMLKVGYFTKVSKGRGYMWRYSHYSKEAQVDNRLREAREELENRGSIQFRNS